eukprot:COSAG06_NODE_7876_length_2345_cov_285.703473_2_plen_95_part_00
MSYCGVSRKSSECSVADGTGGHGGQAGQRTHQQLGLDGLRFAHAGVARVGGSGKRHLQHADVKGYTRWWLREEGRTSLGEPNWRIAPADWLFPC